MAPAEETGYVDPFPGLQSGSATRREWDDPLTLVAAATAESYSNRQDPVLGQEVTKWNEELRIASPHLQDVEAMLFEEGLRCIAVPVLDAQRFPVAAVSVSGPSFRVTAQKLPAIANQLLQCVRGISVDMGFTSPARVQRAAMSA